MIAGLETITAGDLYIGAERVNEVDPRDRNLAFVFQNYALFPHMTVAGIWPSACASAVTQGPRSRPACRVAHLLGIGELLARKPASCPAGSASGRARPCADPRSGCLPARRAALQPRRQAARQHAHRADQAAPAARPHGDPRHPRSGRGHDHGRADLHHERRADRSGGRADGVYRNPADTFVAGFLASPPMNLLVARIESAAPRPCRGLQWPASASSKRRTAHTALARPRGDPRHPTRGHPRGKERTGGLTIDLQVVAVEALGPEVVLVGSLPGPGAPEIAARMGRDFTARIGAKQRVMIDPHAIHLFDPETKKSITRPTASPEERASRHVARPFQQA